MSSSLIIDALIILTAGLIASVVCRRFQISPLIGYLFAGLLVGEGVLGLVHDANHEIEHLAEVGVFLLLFVIGIELSLDDMRQLGRKLFVAGALQMAFVAAPCYFVAHWAGLSPRAALIVAIAISFSSTVITFKILAESGDLESPHGKRAIGVLLFQDMMLVPLLLLIPVIANDQGLGVRDALQLFGVSACFIALIALSRAVLTRWLIPTLAGYRSPEIVVLLSVVVIGGMTAAAYEVGLPPALGAFAAGIVFNGNRWTKQVDALVMPFRETFSAIFFVSLGLVFQPNVILSQPHPGNRTRNWDCGPESSCGNDRNSSDGTDVETIDRRRNRAGSHR